MGVLVSGPQSIGRVLDIGFHLYRSAVVKLIPLSLPIALLSSMFGLFDPKKVMKFASGNPIAVVGFYLMMAVAMILLPAASIFVLDDIGEQRNGLGIATAMRKGLRLVPSMFVAGMAFGLASLLGVLLLVIPGIYLMVAMSLFVFAIALGNSRPIDALNESRRLVRGHWWRTATVLTIAAVIQSAVLYTVIFLLAIAIPGAFNTNTDLVLTPMLMLGFLIQTVVHTAVYPLLYSITLVLYRDLQLRKSGEDLVERIEQSA